MLLIPIIFAALSAFADAKDAVSPSVAKTAAKTAANRVAKITSAKTYYDSKDGVAFFSGHVFVDDEQYKLHADSAYVFMDKSGTNELKRIVAVGNVAVTNETRRAYGAKMSYYRDSGMIVLYAPENGLCEVRDEKEDPPQSVTGTKIKFWLGSDQVEVTGATISAPISGGGMKDLKQAIGGNKK